VADDLRARTAARVLALSPHARVELALWLGDEDLAAFCRAHDVAPPAAMRQLRAQRQHGRTPSRCAAGSRP
jgi:hypothetical protein